MRHRHRDELYERDAARRVSPEPQDLQLARFEIERELQRLRYEEERLAGFGQFSSAVTDEIVRLERQLLRIDRLTGHTRQVAR